MISIIQAKQKKIVILQKENKILREISASIPLAKIKSVEIKNLIADLKKTIEKQKDAVAISAVQIGKPVRLFVVSRRVFSVGVNNPEKIKTPKDDLVFINPIITKSSKDKKYFEEGCLSVKYMYGRVKRPQKVFIEAFDEQGKKFSRGLSGLFAQIVQHESDHLEGILFIDKAKNLVTLTPEEYEKNLAEL